MKLLCLGTGAADWNPANRPTDGEWRHFCSTLVDGTLLIDAGPHIFTFAAERGREDLFDNVTDVLITHSHGDHFSPENVLRLCADGKRRLWGSFACMQKLRAKCGERAETVDFHELHVLDRVSIAGGEVFVLPANHSTDIPEEQPFHYILSRGGKHLLYALDGAWFLRESWNAFRKTYVLDAMVLDATIGDCPGDFRIFEHNDLEMIEKITTTVRKMGVLRAGGAVYANHMARTLHTDQKTLEARLAKSNIIPCYDGMEINI